MKLAFSIPGLIALVSLIFLIHALHDTVHFVSARMACDCWGENGFDLWTFCATCNPSAFMQAVVLLAGTVVNIVCCVTAFFLLKPANEIGKQSLGFSLLFASLPLVRFLAAARGGGDETSAMRIIFSKMPNQNSHLAAAIGLLICVIFYLPAMVRAFLLLKGWVQKIIVFPMLLWLPVQLDKWVITDAMSNLLQKGVLDSEGLPGTPLLVIVWILLWIVILLLTYKKLLSLFRPAFR